MEPRILRVSFLGSGSFSSVYKVVCGNGTPGVEWSLAISLSLVDPAIWSDEPNDTEHCKDWEGLINETVNARLLASLRQAAFNEYFGSFVVRGSDFLRASAQTTPLLAILSNIARRNVHDKSYSSRWSSFRGDTNVMVTLMGLGSAGSLAEFDTTGVSPDTRRAWLFQLASSMLVASRAYGFEHRDFKAGNIILHPTEKTGRQEFVIDIGKRDRQRQGLPDECARVCFAFNRDPLDTASCLVPKLIDFGFSRYAVSSLSPRDSGRTILTQHPLRRSVPTESLDRSIVVNSSVSHLATYPGPEMFFDETCGSERDIASDAFAFGITAMQLLFPTILSAPWWRADPSAFVTACLLAVEDISCDIDRRDIACDMIRLYATIIPGYILLLDALGNSDASTLLHRNNPPRHSIVYQVLSHWRVQLYFQSRVDSVRRAVATALVETADPAAAELVRGCLTWTREERGVLPPSPSPAQIPSPSPQVSPSPTLTPILSPPPPTLNPNPSPQASPRVARVPRYVDSTPAFFRLLFFPYFDPLRETVDNSRKRDAPATCQLVYRDPLSRTEALRPTKHATRTFDRIVQIERDTLDELVPLYSGPDFESTIKERIRRVLSTLAAPPPPMPSPIRKKIRLVTDEEEDAMTASSSTEASFSDPMFLVSTLTAPDEDWRGLA